MDLAWYCARTKPKHEHIAAANISKLLALEVFHPTLRIERSTKRGLVRSLDPLFPCYIFVKCCISSHLDSLKYVNGVNNIVHFGDKIPSIPNATIDDLRACFASGEPMLVEENLRLGSEVILGEGALAGMSASVLKVLSAGQRVQVLMDILGRPTTVEVDRHSVALQNNSLAELVPLLAVRQPQRLQA